MNYSATCAELANYASACDRAFSKGICLVLLRKTSLGIILLGCLEGSHQANLNLGGGTKV